MFKNIWNEFRATQQSLDEKKKTEAADDDTVRMMRDNPKMQKTGGPGGMKGLNKKAQKDVKTALKNDNTNDQEDDGDGMDKVQPKALKKKFKDRKDKDIDNDGDVDSSDEYLHNRRKTVSKKVDENDDEMNGDDKKKKKKVIGKEKEGDIEVNPKMDKGKMNEAKASDFKDVAVMKGKSGTQVKVVKDKQGNHVALFSGKGSTQVPIKKMDKKVLQKALDSFSKNGMIGNTLRSIEEKASIRDRLMSVLGEDMAKNRNPNAAKAETPEDKLKGKGAKDMMNQPTEKDDTVEKGHDDASKAGKVTKPAAARNGADAVRSGDQKIKKVAEAYTKMYIDEALKYVEQDKTGPLIKSMDIIDKELTKLQKYGLKDEGRDAAETRKLTAEATKGYQDTLKKLGRALDDARGSIY